jgi:hypothetical protein
MDKPYYIPIPRTRTKCPHSGLSRSGIYNLIRPTKANGYKAVVASRPVLLPGKRRGRRMVVYRSLMDYLEKGVVPVERLNLRRQWAEFRASRRPEAPALLAISLREVDDLPDDAVLPA